MGNFRILDELANIEGRVGEASQFAAEQQFDRIRNRIQRGVDAEGRMFRRNKNGTKPIVASPRLLSAVGITQKLTTGEQSEVSISAGGRAGQILGRQNRLRKFFSFGSEDKAKVLEDFTKRLLNR